jgi:hypothetical protein
MKKIFSYILVACMALPVFAAKVKHAAVFESPEAYSSGIRKLCQKAAKNELSKQSQNPVAGFPLEQEHNREGFDKCTPNEGCAACNVNPDYKDGVINPSNTRQFNIPNVMRPPHIMKVAGGAPEKFSGKIDSSKYGNYGTSMLQPVETFQTGASNARLNGAAMDMSWASGTMDAICRRGIQPFTPQRYPQYRS